VHCLHKNSFKENVFTLGISNKRIKCLHFVKKQKFDLAPFGSLPSENSFKENVFRMGISNKRIKSLHFVKTNI
jgi:hypothetical protein